MNASSQCPNYLESAGTGLATKINSDASFLAAACSDASDLVIRDKDGRLWDARARSTITSSPHP